MNYFELFDLPLAFRVDQALLAKRYFDIQKKTHPDFFIQATEAEQAEALEQSALANKAFKTFKNADETIKYVLELKGMLEADEKYQLPPDFLMEMMELNEELGDDSAEKITQLEKELYAGVQEAIENYDDANPVTADLERIKAYYFKKKYLQRILDRIDG